jgi:hypothetical protein
MLRCLCLCLSSIPPPEALRVTLLLSISRRRFFFRVSVATWQRERDWGGEVPENACSRAAALRPSAGAVARAEQPRGRRCEHARECGAPETELAAGARPQWQRDWSVAAAMCYPASRASHSACLSIHLSIYLSVCLSRPCLD